jgi:glucokinase
VSATVPVLEVGGTHVSGASVHTDDWTVTGSPERVPIDGADGSERLLDAFARAGSALGATGSSVWGVAMPDPFDYASGIGHFRGVGKFESLDGVDVRAGLLSRLPGEGMVFGNDADAFTLGEWLAGAGRGSDRVMGLTLGTGIGTGWVANGRVVDPGIPPGGRAHRLFVDGARLEDVVSRRAIRAAYRHATGAAEPDVAEIAERARADEPAAAATLAHAMRALGRALAPPVRDFGAEVVVVGGSMSGSWDLFAPWFAEGAADVRLPEIRLAADPDGAALVGAAYLAVAPLR